MAITPNSFTILPLVAVSEDNHVSKEIPRLRISPTPTRDKICISIKTAKNDDTKIRIFDNAGKLVRDLFKIKGGGEFKIYWDGKDNDGKEAPSGVYFVSLQARGTKLQKKTVLFK
jgi:flagellar hook assembly protein FlgD